MLERPYWFNLLENFPINDDWSYAKSVENWLNTGNFKLVDWGEMTLVAHVFWGKLFCSLNGFSHEILRLSTSVLCYFGLIALFLLFIEIGANIRWAFATSLMCLFNPLMFSQSFTFMTDVPFFAVFLWSFLFFVKHLKTDKMPFLILGILFCTWAFLIRQLALVLPLAWLITFLVQGKIKGNLLKIFLPIASSVLVYVVYTYFMQEMGWLQTRYNDKLGLIQSTLLEPSLSLIRNIPGYSIVILAYFGLFFLPLSLPSFLHFSKKERLIHLILSFGFCAILFFSDKLLPCLDNVWVNWGIGPITLFDHYGRFKTSPFLEINLLMQLLITYIGLLSASAFLSIGIKYANQLKQKKQFDPIWLFSLFTLLIYLAPFVLVGIYDRYLIPLFPMFIVLVTLAKNKLSFQFNWKPTMIYVSILALFSISATSTYFSWNRARWNLADKVLDRGISPNLIQGGVEISAWNLFDEKNMKWYQSIDPRYIIVFKEQSNYETLEKARISRPFSKEDSFVYLQIKN